MEKKYFVTFGDKRIEVRIVEVHSFCEMADYLVETVDGQKSFVNECSKSHPVRTDWMWVKGNDIKVEIIHEATIQQEPPKWSNCDQPVMKVQ